MYIKKQEQRILYVIKILFDAFGRYKGQILILTLFGFVSGIIEGIGINAIIPLFSFITWGKSQGTDFISKMIEKSFHALHLPFNVFALLMFICVLFLIKASLTFLAKYRGTLIMTSYEKNERTELLRLTLKTNWTHLMKQKIGYFEKTLMVDVGTSSNLLTEFSSSILLFTSLIVYIAVAININFIITLITLGFGAALFLFLKPYIYKTRAYSQLVTKTNKYVANHINENMIGMKTIKSLALEDEVLKKGENYFNELKNAIIRISYYSNLPTAFIQPISIIFIAFVYIFSSRFTTFDLGTFIVIMYLIQKIFSYIQALQAKLQNVNQLLPFSKSVSEFKKNAILYQEKNSGSKKFFFNKCFEFSDVVFEYKGGKKTIKNISFTINKGETVGLIGPSGAGKTTIVDLMLRLLEPHNGRILIDGEDVSNIHLNEWRRNIGYVSQDMFLLNDTIQNNIAFYQPSLTKKEIMEAARLANIDRFILDQPEELNTMVGERGVLLSGGQKQRIILARMLARKPKILILDEATSALDNESELLVQKALENLRGKITILIIAHRLSTVMHTDKLVVIDNGKIIEEGLPNNLLKNPNTYFYKVHNIHKIKT